MNRFRISDKQRQALAGLEDQMMCAICKSSFRDPVTTRCSHTFCHDCVEEHLRKSSSCFVASCRLPVVPGELNSNPTIRELGYILSRIRSALNELDEYKTGKNGTNSVEMENNYKDDGDVAKTLNEGLLESPIEDDMNRENDHTSAADHLILKMQKDAGEINRDKKTGNKNNCASSIKQTSDENSIDRNIPNSLTNLISNGNYKFASGSSAKRKISTSNLLHRKILANAFEEQEKPKNSNRDKSEHLKLLVAGSILHDGFLNDQETKERLDSMGASIVNDSISHLKPYSVTHVVLNAKRALDGFDQFTFSPKYFYGLAIGAWIVSSKWLENSINATKWLPEDSYEVKTRHGEERVMRTLISSSPTAHPLAQFNYILALPKATGPEIPDPTFEESERELAVGVFRSVSVLGVESRDLSYFFENSKYEESSSSNVDRADNGCSSVLKNQDCEPFSDPEKLVIIVSRHQNATNHEDHLKSCSYCSRLQILVKQFPRSVALDVGWLKFRIHKSRQQRNFRAFFFSENHGEALVGEGINFEDRQKFRIVRKKAEPRQK